MRLSSAITLMLLVLAPPVFARGDTSSFSHAAFDSVLARHVHNGWVDYRGLRNDTAFWAYLDDLRRARPQMLPSREHRFAFWINAYNALTLKGVLDHYPLRSVRDVPGFFDSITYRVAGRQLTLDDIEKGIIREQFRDPRYHIALVCAARGCPPLKPWAYDADKLDAQLDRATRAFLRDPEKNRLDRRTGTLYLSQIFNWYRPEFEAAAGSVLDFVLPYLSKQDQAYLRQNRTQVQIEFLEYDWRLNEPDSGSQELGNRE